MQSVNVQRIEEVSGSAGTAGNCRGQIASEQLLYSVQAVGLAVPRLNVNESIYRRFNGAQR
jgi:hypothetical protein